MWCETDFATIHSMGKVSAKQQDWHAGMDQCPPSHVAMAPDRGAGASFKRKLII